MFVDASALTAFMTAEPGSHEMLARLRQTKTRITSPIAVWETAVAISRILDLPVAKASLAVHDYLGIAEIELMSVPAEAGALALDAFDRYGKGRHPARLNMGDCFAYACARHFEQPLLYKGGDFSQTDIEAG
jgi:ribonuclease VapC